MIGIVDLGGVVADLLTPWIKHLNSVGAKLTIEDVTDFRVDACVPPEFRDRAREYLSTPGLFRRLRPMPGAIEGVRSLYDAGHRILLAQAPLPTEESAGDILHWVHDYLPFIPRHDVYVCYAKERIEADFLIEDSPSHMTQFRRQRPKAKIIAFAWPYNHLSPGVYDLRAESWKDSEAAWEATLKFLSAE